MKITQRQSDLKAMSTDQLQDLIEDAQDEAGARERERRRVGER